MPRWRMRKIDLAGRTFARWTVIQEDHSAGKLKWLVHCECGAESILYGSTLINGLSRSCGCLGREEHIAAITTHGMTGTGLYQSWLAMRTRCNNPSRPSYKDYGARGIRVCARWESSFEAFQEDMGATWSRGLTLERDDNERGYEPGNCRWIPRREQARNRRWCTYLDTPKGRLTINEAAKTFGISFFALRNRIRKGWPADQLLRPPAPGGRKKGCKSTSKAGPTPQKA